MHAIRALVRCSKLERYATTSDVDFPTWFSYGCFGGLASCMVAIALNALYTTLRKRGTTRQLAGAIVTCVISALLLLPAIIWYNVRFSTVQAATSVVEVTLALVYVALWGWVLPLGVTTGYCLFAEPRDSNTSARIPRSHRKGTTHGNAVVGGASLPRRQPGVPAPFVFGEDMPWGWLEHRAGRFQGQRLALNRAVVSIGREEDNDIWLDDETSSRYHAELAWDAEQAYITDCDSLNGVLLNGRRIRGTLVIKSGDLLEIGAHRFLFEMAERPSPQSEQDDLLLHHRRRPSVTLDGVDSDTPDQFTRTPSSASAFPTKPLEQKDDFEFDSLKVSSVAHQLPPSTPGEIEVAPGAFDAWEETGRLDPVAPPRPDRPGGLCVICNGELVGRSFLLDRPVITVGRASESDIIIYDISISRRHAQFLRQANGDYVQDLASRNGTKVNDERLTAPRLLQRGDIICLGIIRLEYTLIPEAQTASIPPLSPPPLARPISGPVPLRLPSKRK